MNVDTLQQAYKSAKDRGKTRVIVPVVRRISGDLLTPVLALLRLRAGSRFPFLFESVEGGEKLARYSFLSRNPYLRIEGRGADVSIEQFADIPVDLPPDGANVFEALKSILGSYFEYPTPGLPRFTGGAVGYMGYDCVRQLERLPSPFPPEESPDSVWHFYRSVAAFDHVKHQLILIAQAFLDEETDLQAELDDANHELDALERDLTGGAPLPPGSLRMGAELPESFGRDAFHSAVDRAREHIHEGDIFQVVLSRRRAFSIDGDPIQLYRALRQVNPSPYLFYLDAGDSVLIGSSPEVLVRAEAGVAELLPIAGTRRRGTDDTDDDRLSAELMADPKERAEHLMLVDLGRNDLGRACEFGSVQVDRYAYIERYSHVMHIVSSVSGQLRDGMSAPDLLAACFPAGTVSGAPKVRAMQIIDDLEPVSRGHYAGAVGYLDFKGDMDTCIAIRTMVVQHGELRLQAGAGIVADSDPEREFQETESKMAALRAAVRLAVNELRPPTFDEDSTDQNRDSTQPFESFSEKRSGA
jgi:anthranilate synthase component I